MRADDFLSALGVVQLEDDVCITLRQGEVLRPEAEIDALATEKSRNGGRNILIFARDQARPRLDDAHGAAEAAVHLAELESDIAATQHDQVPRQGIEIQEGAVGQ